MAELRQFAKRTTGLCYSGNMNTAAPMEKLRNLPLPGKVAVAVAAAGAVAVGVKALIDQLDDSIIYGHPDDIIHLSCGCPPYEHHNAGCLRNCHHPTSVYKWKDRHKAGRAARKYRREVGERQCRETAANEPAARD